MKEVATILGRFSVAGAVRKIIHITVVLSCVQVVVFAAASFFPTCVAKAVCDAFEFVYKPYLTLSRRFIFDVMGNQMGNILLGFLVMLIGMFIYSFLAALAFCVASHVLRRLRRPGRSTDDVCGDRGLMV